jgi:hypothetical protein
MAFKHWFQYPSNGKNESYGVVIALARNPYDWMAAMNENPHHSLAHWNLKKNAPLFWKDFVTRPWTLDRKEYASYLAGEDLKMIDKVLNGRMTQEELLNVPCDKDQSWRHIVPCSMIDRKAPSKKTKVTRSHVMYELSFNQSGLPYNSITELRRDKILNFFQNVPKMKGVSHFIPLRYEDVVSHGSSALLKNIEKAMGIKASCQPSQPQILKRKKISPDFVQWLNNNLDWDMEALVGYEREVPDRYMTGVTN